MGYPKALSLYTLPPSVFKKSYISYHSQSSSSSLLNGYDDFKCWKAKYSFWLSENNTEVIIIIDPEDLHLLTLSGSLSFSLTSNAWNLDVIFDSELQFDKQIYSDISLYF